MKKDISKDCHALGRALRGSGFWRTAAEDPNAVARDRRCRPRTQQLNQDLLLFLGFGLRDPKHGFFGILPELIGV
jgi:hypothetical protein